MIRCRQMKIKYQGKWYIKSGNKILVSETKEGPYVIHDPEDEITFKKEPGNQVGPQAAKD